MPEIALFDLACLILLVWTFIIFSFGYNRGRKRGKLEGHADGILYLRKVSYRQGKCSLCGGKGKAYLITNTNKEHGKEEPLSETDISVHL